MNRRAEKCGKRCTRAVWRPGHSTAQSLDGRAEDAAQHGFFNQRQRIGPSLGVDLAVDFFEQAAVDFSEQGARRGSGKVA